MLVIVLVFTSKLKSKLMKTSNSVYEKCLKIPWGHYLFLNKITKAVPVTVICKREKLTMKK